MNSKYSGFLLVAVGLVIGFLVGAGLMERNAHAQGGPPNYAARYQISANAGGCYMVDVLTGEILYTVNGPARTISHKRR